MRVFKIAFISGSARPVPAVCGGATETMMTHLFEENEVHHKLDITYYSYWNAEAERIARTYRNTNISYYHPSSIDKFATYPSRFLRKITNGRTYVRYPFVRWCAKEINAENFDGVIIEGNYYQTLQLRKAIKTPIILHMHIDGLNVETDNGKNIINACKGIFAISQYCKKRIVQIDPTQEKKVHVLKNTIDVSHFNSEGNENAAAEIRQKYGIRPEQKLIVFCGRVTQEKGVRELLEAFLKLDDPNTFLFIIGSSVYKDGQKTKHFQFLEKMAEKHENVKFIGFIDQKDLPKYYSAADISVVPSICQEAAGNVIPESMGCGLPVIATRRGGIPEYADESACILVDADEKLSDHLAEAIHSLTTNEQLYQSKREHARVVALQYDKSYYYNNFCDLVVKVLQGD